jgi:HAMP domain-containing protein
VTTTTWIVFAVAAVVLVAAVAMVRRNRSPQSSVDSFRRQIDALGPAARRTVVDQVQQTAATRDPEPDTAGPDADATPGDATPGDATPGDATPGGATGDDAADEDGARGT